MLYKGKFRPLFANPNTIGEGYEKNGRPAYTDGVVDDLGYQGAARVDDATWRLNDNGQLVIDPVAWMCDKKAVKRSLRDAGISIRR